MYYEPLVDDMIPSNFIMSCLWIMGIVILLQSFKKF